MASITEFAIRWRLPELVCVMAAWEVIKLIMDLVPKYDQYVPPVSLVHFRFITVQGSIIFCS